MESLTSDFDIAWDIAGLSLIQRFISIRQRHAGGEGDKTEDDCWVEHVLFLYSCTSVIAPAYFSRGCEERKVRRSNLIMNILVCQILDCFVGQSAPSSQ
jgi:hypothetical protein